MGKNIINLDNSALVLSKVKTIAIEKGIDVSTNQKLVDYALKLLSDTLK